MDTERKVRFLIPPTVFYSLLILLAYSHGFPTKAQIEALRELPGDMTAELLGLIIVGSLFVLATGFVLGAVTLLLTRVLFLAARLIGLCWGRSGNYETFHSSQCFEKIWGRVGGGVPRRKSLNFYAIMTFDHDILFQGSPGINQWMMRRWSSFTISFQSAISVVLAFAFFRLFHSLDVGPKWWIIISITVGALVFQAAVAWWEGMQMMEFQCRRTVIGSSPKSA